MFLSYLSVIPKVYLMYLSLRSEQLTTDDDIIIEYFKISEQLDNNPLS